MNNQSFHLKLFFGLGFIVLISSIVLGIVSATSQNHDILDDFDQKILVAEYSVDNNHVSYYHHMINGILVKQDYLQVTCNKKTGKVEEVEKHWTPIDASTLSTPKELVTLPVEKENVLWMQPVVFAKRNDLSYFYQIQEPKEFPLRCWEIRLNTGETILVDETGEQIGKGIPAPSDRKGFSLSGYCQDSSPDCWIAWRQNADNWYAKWTQETKSISLPTPSTISSYISDPAYHLFYELAHGASTYFQADSPGSYYYASDVEDAMTDREKMTFSFIGSCEGMTDTGPGTFSHEFRKGSFEETATIGYSGMGSCPGWSVSLEWQDYMFYVMNNGYPIKEAFDLACLEYPTIADCVVFVGDTDMMIFESEDDDDDDDIGIPPNIFVSYPPNNQYVGGIVNITGSADDLDGSIDHIFLQIDDGDWIEVDAEPVWDYAWNTTTVDDGKHLITAVAVDDTGLSSGCRYVHVNVWNRAYDISIDCPTEAYVSEQIHFKPIIVGGNYYPYWINWDFGDGSESDEFEPLYQYQTAGEYQVILTLVDALNRTVTASKSIHIIEADEDPPFIKIIQPENGIYVNNKKIIDFPMTILFGETDCTFNVTDEKSGIQQIQIHLNGDLIVSTNQSPCTWTWDVPCFGINIIEITAIDTMNNEQMITKTIWKFF